MSTAVMQIRGTARERIGWLVRVPLTALVVLMGLGAWMVPGQAQAEGGNSIASAPSVVIGSHETGNTANGLHLGSPSALHGWNQFWKIKLKAGDLLVVDWEVSVPGSNTRLQVFPVGTNDFTVEKKASVARQFEGGAGKAELRYKARSAGIYPLDFRTYAREGVGYAFTARVHHRRAAG